MKTADKILLIAFGLVIIGLIATFVTLRMELTREVYKGSGHIVSEERTLASFTEIEARGNVIIHLEQSNNHGVRIETDDNLIGFVETTVRRGRLKIRLEELIHEQSTINLYVLFNELNHLEANLGSHYISAETLYGDVLTQQLGSGARSMLLLSFKEVDVRMRSGAFSKLSGNTQLLRIEASGGSILNARELHANNCNVSSKSGAQVRVFVTEKLDSRASSGGIIRYHGKPSIKSWRSSSGGQIIQK